jgi:hypothetical protein
MRPFANPFFDTEPEEPMPTGPVITPAPAPAPQVPKPGMEVPEPPEPGVIEPPDPLNPNQLWSERNAKLTPETPAAAPMSPVALARTNSPLALPGSFADPGSPGAVPFRSPNFLSNRVVGGPKTFGPGATLFGGDTGFSGVEDTGAPKRNPQEDELIRRIVMGLGARR